MPAPDDLIRVEAPGPDSPWSLRILARHEIPCLHPRVPGTQIRAPHPGTGVRHGDRLHEVIAIEPGEPPFAWRYQLQAHDPGLTLRTFVDLDGGGLERLAADVRAERERAARLGRLSVLLPLVGLLPARRLERLRREVGLDPRRATVASALFLLVPSLPVAVYGVLVAVAGGLGPFFGAAAETWMPPAPVVLFGLYFAFESAARLKYPLAVGSAPVAAAVSLLEATGLLEAEPPLATKSRPRDAVAHLTDRVTRVPAVGGRGPELTIESARAKDWPEHAVIGHEDRYFVVAEHREERRRGRACHVYRLVEAPEEARFRPVIAYRPAAALVERAERDRRDRAERLDMWKPVLGFFPATRQLEWQERHGFDARRATRISSWLEIAVAGANLVISIARMATVPGEGPIEAFLGAIAGLFLLEGALRLQTLRREGRPSGSILFAWAGRRGASRGRTRVT